jgi:hypothetical protein
MPVSFSYVGLGYVHGFLAESYERNGMIDIPSLVVLVELCIDMSDEYGINDTYSLHLKFCRRELGAFFHLSFR